MKTLRKVDYAMLKLGKEILIHDVIMKMIERKNGGMLFTVFPGAAIY